MLDRTFLTKVLVHTWLYCFVDCGWLIADATVIEQGKMR